MDNNYIFPTSVKEMRLLGWEQPDIILFTGDAFVDHPSFGTAVIARILQREGYLVAIVPQPNWRDDLRDFKKIGAPRLFFGVNSGAMDSMVNHYTANKRLRSDDAYTPEGKASFRPDYAVTVYTKILKELYPEIPVVIGGVEASLRRLTHYDYWQDKLLPSILVDSGADYITYGMGERATIAIAKAFDEKWSQENIHKIPQIAWLENKVSFSGEESVTLPSYEECLADKRKFVEHFNIVEREANRLHPSRLIEPVNNRYIHINPPYPPAVTKEIDWFFDLPYTKKTHPRYKDKHIPAYEMIKNSINIHRGCFGGCNFCTIAAHQGRFIESRSEDSIMKEVRELIRMDFFRGTISDMGGPSANMYKMEGFDKAMCEKCLRKSCLYPAICKNLNHDHTRLTELYNKILSENGVKRAFIGSGIRYDLFLNEKGYNHPSSERYLKEVITKHTSGRLKVAPEHTEPSVLEKMFKPDFKLFEILKREFEKITRDAGLRYQIVPYFISSHPGCTYRDMERLSYNRSLKGVYMEQVQDFTPTPMTASSVMYYTELDIKSFKPIFVEKNKKNKKEQKNVFFR